MNEIERKWLVKELPKDYELYNHFNIEQYYVISDNNSSLRVRYIEPNIYLMTIKSGNGLTRKEIEFTIPKYVYEQIKQLPYVKYISKTRYIYQDCEIDIFDNKDLILVEVEFENEDEAALYPGKWWFGEEVTYNKDYLNLNLAI